MQFCFAQQHRSEPAASAAAQAQAQAQTQGSQKPTRGKKLNWGTKSTMEIKSSRAGKLQQ